MATTTTPTITTRQQLIQTERDTRKLAKQKRNQRKDAFLSAQKQLLKTTDYIEQLDELSHTLTESINETYELLNHAININNITHHFSQDINQFNLKHTDNALHTDNDNDYTDTIIPNPVPYSIDALITCFDDINAGKPHYDETYLMNHIDVPFLSTLNDMSLFRDKIQSCLYSSCIHIENKHNNNKYDISFDDDSKLSDNRLISVDQYCSYLSAREVLIEKLLHFMLLYPKQKEKENDKGHPYMEQYYHDILPFCLYSLIVILYETSIYIELNGNDTNHDGLYTLFEDFIKKSAQEIQVKVVESLQIVNDKPSLLMSCLNNYIALIHSSTHLKWTQMFHRLYGSSDDMIFIDFISDYVFHSSFYECFKSISNVVCNCLEIDFKMLFGKLSNSAISNDNMASFSDIMNSIQHNLSAILTFDHHGQLLQSQLLSKYMDGNITPFIEQSTKNTLSQFISALETHLNNTNNTYKHTKSNSFSLDEEYLEISVCSQKLETFIMSVIEEYTTPTPTQDDEHKQHVHTPISLCLIQMVSSISGLKLRALKHWSSAMSLKLFADVSLHLERKLSLWNIYESYYTKTIWKSIIIKDNDDDDIEELTINIPCQASEYIHDICFQFIQILLMIITQKHVPKTIISVLENEFRLSTSTQLNKIFKTFLSQHCETNDISESFGLQLYFDVSFARAILTTLDCNPLWEHILSMICDEYIELVTMEYGSKYLENEIRNSVNNCLLMYGVHTSSYNKYIMNNDNDNDNIMKSRAYAGGNIFAKPVKKIPRIPLLPVASYQISQSVLKNEDNRNSISSLNKSPIRMSLLNHSTLLDDANNMDNQQDKIAQSFNEFTSGAMSHANTLLKNFGSMFQ